MTPEKHAEWVAKLRAIRQRYIDNGGKLMSLDEIDAAMRELRDDSTSSDKVRG